MANDLISVYICNELKKIEEAKHVQVPIASSNLKWTDSKVSLTVLIYALHSAPSFNNGNIELKEIGLAFSKLCNIDLGDFYRTWAEIKLKKDPTKFLDILKVALENRIKADMQ
jgi:hypothetical protein